MSQADADWLAIALEHHRAGNLPLAEQLYRQGLSRAPQSAHAWHLLGALCLQSSRAAEAVDLIARAIALEPDKPEFYNHLGAAYGTLQQHDEAVATLRRAVQLSPQSATSHYNLGTALRNAGRLDEATASFRHALAADPRAAEAAYNLANTLVELKQLDEAEAAFRQALAARPNYVKALVNLANLLRDRKSFEEAIGLLRQAVALDPRHTKAAMNLGAVLRDAGQFDEAVEWLQRAVALTPDSAEAQNNLGTALQALSAFDQAERCYDRAVTLNPELPEAHFTRAMHRIRREDIAGGFAEFEWRWKCKSYSTHQFVEPRWDGSPLAGRTILLRAEQGLGDTLHFIRYAADVQKRGGTVVVECQPPLVPLLRSCPGIDRLVPSGTAPGPFDVQCPMFSLPNVLGLTMDDLARGTYLHAEAELVDQWRERLEQYRGFRVGLCWQGNRDYLFDSQRSIPLERFAPLSQVPGVRLISLQKGPGSEQLSTCGFAVVDLGDQLDTHSGPFLDTAAVMKNLDLVITSDTSIVHLAGGLGVPTWVAISAHSDWRWFIDRTDSPWYPSLRLFRQRRLNQWEPVFQELAVTLGERALGKRVPGERVSGTLPGDAAAGASLAGPD